MRRTIWKFPVVARERFTVSMPKGAEVLDVQVQHSEAMMWVLVDPTAPIEPRTFAVHGTGHEFVDDGYAYIGTFQLSGGGLVFHLFEVEPGRNGGGA
jgi:hypothetical protein